MDPAQAIILSFLTFDRKNTPGHTIIFIFLLISAQAVRIGDQIKKKNYGSPGYDLNFYYKLWDIPRPLRLEI